MATWLATIAYVVGILGLIACGRDRSSGTSGALWVPTAWFLIASSRMISDWLAVAGVTGVGWSPGSPEHLLEGSPFDRLVLTSAVVVGVTILSRRAQSGVVLLASWPVVLFFLFGGVSTLWSDYPSVALKRWIKAVGDLVMVLIVVTESNPTASIKRFFLRVSVLLVPLSVLCFKYVPAIGRGYDQWTGRQVALGITLDKNLLGMTCLIVGLASEWALLQAWRSGTRSQVICHGVVLAMTVWLIGQADSMTSTACFILAGGLMFMTRFEIVARRRWLIHCLVLGIVGLAGYVLFHGGSVLHSVGRDSTLTGRTEVWSDVLALRSDPLLGSGFESFWLGPRLEQLWSKYWWRPNEAHNGYIEVVLNLGWIGLGLFMMLMVKAYRRMVCALSEGHVTGGLMLAFWVAALVYNVTESAIRMFNPMWIVLLLMTVESFRLGSSQSVRSKPQTAFSSVGGADRGLGTSGWVSTTLDASRRSWRGSRPAES